MNRFIYLTESLLCTRDEEQIYIRATLVLLEMTSS